MTDQPTVGDMMAAYAQDAVDHARAAFGVNLDPVGGPRSFPIYSKGQSFPAAWCFRRLTNGPEDNVWHKLQILYMREGPEAAAP
jgi:hypothetical protein